jgi:mono/diheme cytochrome c family protein
MIYHIITNGQNVMPSYASQVTREERWAIVNYIRVLQRAKNASDADLIEINKESGSNVTN